MFNIFLYSSFLAVMIPGLMLWHCVNQKQCTIRTRTNESLYLTQVLMSTESDRTGSGQQRKIRSVRWGKPISVNDRSHVTHAQLCSVFGCTIQVMLQAYGPPQLTDLLTYISAFFIVSCCQLPHKTVGKTVLHLQADACCSFI